MRARHRVIGAGAAAGEAGQSGYILVALLVGIAIASVWMAAALPAWRQQVMREREAELIFRGEQYARAIWLYTQKNNGQYPQNLDDLVSQHYLRKRWKDPITGDDFSILAAAFCATGVPGGGGPAGGGPLGAPGGGGPGRTTPAPPTGGGAPGIVAPPAGRPGGGPITSGGSVPPSGTIPPGTIGGAATQPGICGVVSKSDKASIKVYQQQQQYNLWRFTTLIAQQQAYLNRMKYGGQTAPPAQMPGGAVPGRGQPGRQGAPGGFTPIGPNGPGRGPGGPPIGPGGNFPQPGPGPVGPGQVPGGPGRGRV